jgi:hypothetical protein
MDSLHQEDWKQAMEEECTSILHNNTFTTSNSLEARQLRVNPTGFKWVFKMNLNPDGTLGYKPHQQIMGYIHTDIGETHALVGQLTTF